MRSVITPAELIWKLMAN